MDSYLYESMMATEYRSFKPVKQVFQQPCLDDDDDDDDSVLSLLAKHLQHSSVSSQGPQKTSSQQTSHHLPHHLPKTPTEVTMNAGAHHTYSRNNDIFLQDDHDDDGSCDGISMILSIQDDDDDDDDDEDEDEACTIEEISLGDFTALEDEDGRINMMWNGLNHPLNDSQKTLIISNTTRNSNQQQEEHDDDDLMIFQQYLPHCHQTSTTPAHPHHPNVHQNNMCCNNNHDHQKLIFPDSNSGFVPTSNGNNMPAIPRTCSVPQTAMTPRGECHSTNPNDSPMFKNNYSCPSKNFLPLLPTQNDYQHQTQNNMKIVDEQKDEEQQNTTIESYQLTADEEKRIFEAVSYFQQQQQQHRQPQHLLASSRNFFPNDHHDTLLARRQVDLEDHDNDDNNSNDNDEDDDDEDDEDDDEEEEDSLFSDDDEVFDPMRILPPTFCHQQHQQEQLRKEPTLERESTFSPPFFIATTPENNEDDDDDDGSDDDDDGSDDDDSTQQQESTPELMEQQVLFATMSRMEQLMSKSSESQLALQEYDRKNGLPRSHCQTMVNSSRSRMQLQTGMILPKWNGKPLLSIPGALMMPRPRRQSDKVAMVARASTMAKCNGVAGEGDKKRRVSLPVLYDHQPNHSRRYSAPVLGQVSGSSSTTTTKEDLLGTPRNDKELISQCDHHQHLENASLLFY